MATRRDMIAILGGALAGLPLAARAQEPAPRVAFHPALGVAQAFHVSYRLRDRPAASPAQDRFVIDYRLTVTPLARNADGWRLRLLVGAIERPPDPAGINTGGTNADGMNMVVAAALMLDGLPIELQVDARGSLGYVVDWPVLQRTLMERANARLGPFASVGHSVAANDADQVAWHLARGLAAISFARAYLVRAERTGASTVSWFGTPVDITVARADAEGSVAITWVRPAGPSAQANDEGRAVFRRDGFVSLLTRSSAPPGSDTQEREIVAVEAVAA